MTALKKGIDEAKENPMVMKLIAVLLSIIGVMFGILVTMLSVFYTNLQTSIAGLNSHLEKTDERVSATASITAGNTKDIANIIGGLYTVRTAKHEDSPKVPNPNE